MQNATINPLRKAFGYDDLAGARMKYAENAVTKIDFFLHADILKHRFGWDTDTAVVAVIEMRNQNYDHSTDEFYMGDFNSPGSLFLWDDTPQGNNFWYVLDVKFEYNLQELVYRLQRKANGRLSRELAVRAVKYGLLTDEK